jgi:hypothetical protein
MKKVAILSFFVLVFSAAIAHADVVILRDGKSYSGAYTGASSGKLAFKDGEGIQYTFPVNQIQSLVFSNTEDHIALRNGQSYAGQLMGVKSINFQGTNGISYVFPLSDVSSLVITGDSQMETGGQMQGAAQMQQQGSAMAPQAPPLRTRNAAYARPAASGSAPSVVIPMGTQISVRTDNAIDSAQDASGKLYPGRIQQDIVDGSGAVAIPAGTAAQLQLVDMSQNGSSQGKDLVLDLYSVDINGKQYRVDTSSVTEGKSGSGIGMNRKTAEYAGGGAALGALLGAAFGGGRGAGIGALAGVGGGALTQLLTHGKQVKVPAETVLTFQLVQTLVLHP